tara:strand:+ start:822 stop:1727 length:906 start_codon:yes stop_codon:yes gene_type:complete
MIGVSLRRLEVFKTVVDIGRFGAAADHLGIAQPSVSAHIKALENHLGQPLFIRHRGRPPRLTTMGETFYTYAADALSRASDIGTTLRAAGEAEPGRFSVAAQRNLANLILPGHLAAFLKSHPGAKIVSYSEVQEKVLAMIRDAEVDLALFLAIGPVSGIRSELMGHLDLVLVVSPDHPLAGRRKIAPEELAGQAFIGGIEESNFARMIAVMLRRAGIRDYDVVLQLQDGVAAKQMAQLGVGFTCSLRCAVEPEIAAGTLVPLDLSSGPGPLQVRWAYAENREIPEIAFTLIRYLNDRRPFS